MIERLALRCATGLAAVAVAGLGASTVASRAGATPAVGASAVVCVNRPAVQPPPVGLPKLLAGQGVPRESRPATLKIGPVCPAGTVPLVKPSPKGIPKGNPVLRQKSASGRMASSDSSSGPPPPPPPACDGVIYPAIDPTTCFYYAGASDTHSADGGGLTMTVQRPAYDGSGGTGHSLEEIAVQGDAGNGDIVELGSSVSTDQFGDSNPHLFVYHWVTGAQTCYSCGWQQYSNTYYPGMDLSPAVGSSVYNGYVYYAGNWWAWFNDQWVGFFPGSLWGGNYHTASLIQWFGEVATHNGLPPRTQMGDGLFPSNPAAASMSTLCDVDAKAWVCWYRDQQVTYRTFPKFYDVAPTGFGAILLGGPGL